MLHGNSQFASDGLLLMIIGGMGVYLRAVPFSLCTWFMEQTTMSITVKDDDAAFVWIKEWIHEQQFISRIRRVDLDTTLRGTETALLPAPGQHWFWHAGRPFWVSFQRSEESKGWNPRRAESLTFRTVGRDQKFLSRLVAEVVICHKTRVARTSRLYAYDEGCWAQIESYTPRLLESVILRPGEKEYLVRDVSKFTASRERYRRLGIPYHRGYLLYGPPGTGKTSLVSALAAEFGMSVYVVNLTEFNDRTLKRAVTEVPEQSAILFEDIDCMKTGQHRDGLVEATGRPENRNGAGRNPASEQSGVTLSGLLNVLDGVHAPENVLFFMTSNRIEALDAALLRPGRIDVRLLLGFADRSQKVELYRRFFPGATEADAHEFIRAHFAETMAEFQGLLLRLERSHEGFDYWPDADLVVEA
jgi:chaperone BCS1